MTPVRGSFLPNDFAQARVWLTQPLGGWGWDNLTDEDRADRFEDEGQSAFLLLPNDQLVRVRSR